MLTILTLILVAIAVVLAYAATRPDTFRIQRSTGIQAPPEKIFPFIDDFHQWKAWSPWEKIDPEAKASFSGASSGVGAIYEWSGNRDIGQGRMKITESSPPSRIVLDIDFIKPFKGHNQIEFTLLAQGDVTTVTQAMYGCNSFPSKLIGLFFCMEDMVGKKYEEGLASLKSLAEK